MVLPNGKIIDLTNYLTMRLISGPTDFIGSLAPKISLIMQQLIENHYYSKAKATN